MRLSDEQSVALKVMVAVAISAFFAIIDSQTLHASPLVYVTVSVVVATVFALGAMRRPWYFLAIAVLTALVSPKVFDSSAHDMFEGGYQGGWLLGFIAGMILRNVRQKAASVPNDFDSIQHK